MNEFIELRKHVRLDCLPRLVRRLFAGRDESEIRCADEVSSVLDIVVEPQCSVCRICGEQTRWVEVYVSRTA